MAREDSDASAQEGVNFKDYRCHVLRKHGWNSTPQFHEDCIPGNVPPEIGQSKVSSSFSSPGAMWGARMHFMQKMESEMKRMEQEILAGRHRTEWSAVVDLPYSIGSGKIAIDSQVVEVTEVTSVRFVFEYQNGAWYETTAYPNVRAHHRKMNP